MLLITFIVFLQEDQNNDYFWLVTIVIICVVFYLILMCSPLVKHYNGSGWQSAAKTSHERNKESKTKTGGQPKPSSKSYKNHHPYTFTPQKDRCVYGLKTEFYSFNFVFTSPLFGPCLWFTGFRACLFTELP